MNTASLFDFILIEGRTVAESIQFYGLLISAVVAASTIAQVFVAYLIARSVDRSQRRMAELSSAQHIHNQWQTWNTLVITNPEFREAVVKFEKIKDSDYITKKRFLAFFSLNIIEEAYFTQKSLGLRGSLLETHIREQVEMLRSEEDLIKEIFATSRGYNREFVAMCEKILNETP